MGNVTQNSKGGGIRLIIVRREDALHKARLLGLLTEILDNKILAHCLYFKGGTCASMIGALNRFSVDLDFDLKMDGNGNEARTEFHAIFKDLNLEVKNESVNALQFFVKYESPPNQRNTIQIDALNVFVAANEYAPFYLPEIDRTALCQTIPTMFANKLVAPLDRYAKHKSIAGRDMYDIHHFFIKGYDYTKGVITERTGKDISTFFETLIGFIGKNVSTKLIDEDLNTLLPYDLFKNIRKNLKQETLMFLNQELAK